MEQNLPDFTKKQYRLAVSEGEERGGGRKGDSAKKSAQFKNGRLETLEVQGGK